MLKSRRLEAALLDKDLTDRRMSPRQHYLSYLQTDELVNCLRRSEEKIRGLRARADADYRQMWTEIRTDILTELHSRQMRIPGA